MARLPDRRPTPGSNPRGQRPRPGPPGGPDRPPSLAQRRKSAAKKSKRIVWYGANPPSAALRKKYKVGKPGSGLFKNTYVAFQKKRPPKKTPPAPPPAAPAATAAPAAPAGPAPYTGPYASLPEWARNYMLGYDGQALHHQAYVADKVLPWIGQALGNIGTFNQAAQDQLLNFYNQGAGNQIVGANAGPPNVAPVAPGAGPFSGDAAYALNAGKQALGAGSAITQQLGQYQTATAKMAPTPISQGVIKSLGDYAAGLPAMYAEKRNERLLQIQQFVEQQRQFDQRQAQAQSQFDQNMALAQARFEEDKRQYGEQFAYRQFNDSRAAAISQLNAQNGLILGLGQLGLKGTELAAELQPPTGEVPYGYVQLPNGDYVRDPNVPQATDGGDGSGSGGGPEVDTRPFKQGTNGWFIQNGWVKVRNRKHLDALRKQGIQVQKSVDGSGVWFKPKSGSGEKPKPSPYKITGDPNESFVAWYQKNVDGKFSPTNARVPVSNWINFNRRFFTQSEQKGLVNEGKLIQFLERNIGDGGQGVPRLVVDYLRKNFMVKRGNRYFWKQ